MRECAEFGIPEIAAIRRVRNAAARSLLTGAYRCVYTVHVGYIHYSRPCRTRDAGAARAETRTAHRRTFDACREDDCCRSLRYAAHERGTLDIIISNGSSEPIYEQITRQIKAAIMAGDVNEGDPLPSIRALANDLRISVITTKRAYAELEEAGFIDTVQGKGSFVAGGNLELLREERLRQVEGHLARAVAEAENAGIEAADLHAMLDVLLEEE